MKVLIFEYITKNKISIDNLKIGINNNIIGKIINIPTEYIELIIEKSQRGYNIYGKIIYNHINNDINRGIIKNRKVLINMLKKISDKNEYPKFNGFKNSKLVKYTNYNYFYGDKYCINLDNHIIEKISNIKFKNIYIHGGFININHKNIIENKIDQSVFVITKDYIKTLYRKIINTSKKIYGDDYNYSELINIYRLSGNKIETHNVILIYYDEYTNFTESEKNIINCIGFEYLWFAIMNNLCIDKIDKRIINFYRKGKTDFNKRYISRIFRKSMFYLQDDKKYNLIKINKPIWECNILNNIKKYTNREYHNLISVYDEFKHGIEYKEKNQNHMCEICYDQNKNGYISCNNKHVFCEDCYLTNHILNKKCPICRIDNNINWYIDNDKLMYYKFGIISHPNFKNSKIYINNKNLFTYYKKMGINVINNKDEITSDTIIYKYDDDLIYNTNINNLQILDIS